MNKKGGYSLVFAIALAVTALWQLSIRQSDIHSPINSEQNNQNAIGNPSLLAAYKNGKTKLQVKGRGTIIKILKDDLEGSKHQRLLLKVNHNQTVLIAHNIDLAPRIPSPIIGKSIEFYGEYVWNNKGGVIHWTHRDPRGKHPSGWLLYEGQRYE